MTDNSTMPKTAEEWRAIAEASMSFALKLAEELKATAKERDEYRELAERAVGAAEESQAEHVRWQRWCLALVLTSHKRKRGRPPKDTAEAKAKGRAGAPLKNTPEFLSKVLKTIEAVMAEQGLRRRKHACVWWVTNNRPAVHRRSEARQLEKLVSLARLQSRKSSG